MRKSITIKRLFLIWLTQVINTLRNLTVLVTFFIRKWSTSYMSTKKACNLGKLYLLQKIHSRLFNLPGRPILSNCRTPTESVSEFLDHHLKPIMQNGLPYIRDFRHILEKIKTTGRVPENVILITVDVVGLYPNNPHQAGLKALKKLLKRKI